MYELLAELVSEQGATAVVVSHDPASTAWPTVVHIRDGRVSEEPRGQVESVVVGAGGWLRVPEDALRAAGIGERALSPRATASSSSGPPRGRHHRGSALAPRVEGQERAACSGFVASRADTASRRTSLLDRPSFPVSSLS